MTYHGECMDSWEEGIFWSCWEECSGWVLYFILIFCLLDPLLQSVSLHISDQHVAHLKLNVICQLCLSKKIKKKKELQISKFYCRTTYFSIRFCQFLFKSLLLTWVYLYKCYNFMWFEYFVNIWCCNFVL